MKTSRLCIIYNPNGEVIGSIKSQILLLQREEVFSKLKVEAPFSPEKAIKNLNEIDDFYDYVLLHSMDPDTVGNTKLILKATEREVIKFRRINYEPKKKQGSKRIIRLIIKAIKRKLKKSRRT